MRLAINYRKCRRSGQSSYLHPELFKVDDAGAPIVLVEHPGEEQREASEEAVDLCPNGAISFESDE